MKISAIFLTIVTAILINSSAHAQEYLKQYAPNRQWIEEVLDVNYDKTTGRLHFKTYSDYCLNTVVGDTIVGTGKNKHTAKIIRRVSSSRGGDIYYFCVYEDNGKTYYYNEKFNLTATETDMSLKKGDKKKTYILEYDDTKFKFNGDYLTVVEEEIINIKGIDRKKLTVSIGDYPYNIADFWIEGIGGFYKMHLYNTETVSHGGLETEYPTKFFDGDKCVFSINDYDPSIVFDDNATYPPIPASIDETQICTTVEEDMPIYDLMGRRVVNPKHGQLYIRGTEKMIW